MIAFMTQMSSWEGKLFDINANVCVCCGMLACETIICKCYTFLGFPFAGCLAFVVAGDGNEFSLIAF